MKKRMYILAGANGSGKSTLASVLLPDIGVEFVNPDEIAVSLAPNDPVSVRVEAGREALKRIESLIASGSSFAVESTLSGRGHLKIIEKAKRAGYEVIIAYVFVDSAEVCINRIRVRVARGGHAVPDDDVRRRYGRSKRNFLRLYAPLADHWMLYYNGVTDFLLVAHGNGATNIVLRERYEDFKREVENA